MKIFYLLQTESLTNIVSAFLPIALGWKGALDGGTVQELNADDEQGFGHNIVVFAAFLQSQFKRHVVWKNASCCQKLIGGLRGKFYKPLRQVCSSGRENLACQVVGPDCERASSYASSAKDHFSARNLLHSCSTCWCFWCLFWCALQVQVVWCAPCSSHATVFCYQQIFLPNGAKLEGEGGNVGRVYFASVALIYSYMFALLFATKSAKSINDE